jgi:hypothetical protein
MPAFAIQTEGKVVSVNTGATCPEVVIKDSSGATLNLIVTKMTDVQKGTKDMDLSMLKPGSTVVVRYRVKGGKNIAKYIGYVSGNLQRISPACRRK